MSGRRMAAKDGAWRFQGLLVAAWASIMACVEGGSGGDGVITLELVPRTASPTGSQKP